MSRIKGTQEGKMGWETILTNVIYFAAIFFIAAFLYQSISTSLLRN